MSPGYSERVVCPEYVKQCLQKIFVDPMIAQYDDMFLAHCISLPTERLPSLHEVFGGAIQNKGFWYAFGFAWIIPRNFQGMHCVIVSNSMVRS